MKRFIRSVLVTTASLGVLLAICLAYVYSVHISPDKIAFINAIFHRGVTDTLSDDYTFDIWKFGHKLEIPFEVSYTREVAVVLTFKNNHPTSGMHYSGRLLIQYYQGNRLVQSKLYSRYDSSPAYPGSQTNSIVLDTQVLPLHGGTGKHSVFIEVLEADPRFEQYQDGMKVQVQGTFSW